MVDDFLAENEFFGAKQRAAVLGLQQDRLRLAHLLHARGIKAIGLTSASNVAFVKSLGCYDEVVTYDRVLRCRRGQPVPMSTWPATARCARRCTGTSATA